MTTNLKTDFNTSTISGIMRYIPQFLGKNYNTTIYKFINSIEMIINRIVSQKNEIINNITYNINDLNHLEYESLILKAEEFNIKKYLWDTSTSIKMKWYGLWNYLSNRGGSEQGIIQSIYWFMGDANTFPGASFDSDGNINTSSIIITTPYDSGLYTIEATNSISISDPASVFVVSEGSFPTTFKVTINLQSGSSTDRNSYQYWNSNNRINDIQNIINESRPVGSNNIIELVMV